MVSPQIVFSTIFTMQIYKSLLLTNKQTNQYIHTFSYNINVRVCICIVAVTAMFCV